ncbi:unnamed protein product [Ectocarpus sp. CCAP 1310/34]|nr:unnamed protein product [Ectocarpus sp. CCAP 1310/34]
MDSEVSVTPMDVEPNDNERGRGRGGSLGVSNKSTLPTLPPTDEESREGDWDSDASDDDSDAIFDDPHDVDGYADYADGDYDRLATL